MNHLTLPYCADTLLLFDRMRDLPHPVLLHSSDRSTPSGRYDILAADPARIVLFDAGVLTVGSHRRETSNPLTALRDFFAKRQDESFEHFRSGFIGYLGYGLQHTLERLPPSPRDVTGMPALFGGDYHWAVVIDRKLKTTKLWYDSDVSAAYAADIVRKLTSLASTSAAEFSMAPGFTSTTTDASYRDAFYAIKQYIGQGDCYQVNLARHYATRVRGDRTSASWSAYKRLVASHPVPFGAYLSTPYGDVVSVSPERFVKYANGLIETSPIKGTAPRDPDAVRDAASADRLQNNPKDRAENLMIVDLLRNDLGRICTPGSIRATRLFSVESFSSVHHLVSTIRGAPKPTVDAWSTLTASFPGGSVTGAPKIRAMQIINELEPVARSVYCGSIGYVDSTGAMDTNIAIRTLAFAPTGVHCWGGGAVVADSSASAELLEIDHKIGRLLQTVASLGASKSCRA